MKSILIMITFAICFNMNGQWKYKSGSNQFDGSFKMSYVIGKGGKFPYNSPTFVINRFESRDINVYLTGIGYTGCDYNSIKISFGDNKIYEDNGVTENSDRDALFIEGFREMTMLEFINMVKSKSKMYVRFSNRCGQSDYVFGLSGSTKAIDYAIGSWIREQEGIIQEEKLSLDPIRDYYKKLTCDDYLDTVAPMHTDYIREESNLFRAAEGNFYLKDRTLVNFCNSNRTSDRIKIRAIWNNKETIYHVSYQTAKIFTDNDDIIDEMYVGLIETRKRMDECE